MVLTDWHRLLKTAEGFQLRPGATEENLAAYEKQLEACFPLQLRKLYLVSDGVFDERGRWFVIWPLSELPWRNQHDWGKDGARRCELVAFGDDGTGAPFCVPRDGGPGVFVWDPLTAAPQWLANDVGDFWSGRSLPMFR
ncbi:SMI1/KNR4 family protein [Actinoplanes sp. M2I2]|uniref:SMI1/KNR4 family protein n=1 Tax=Actinoplanes sp. M2I2 TaxID=1734444 RepID=UPI002022273D|nr:SMI1/KNR4 family protein [Actinoplanes sp. M2I2]